MNVGNVIEQYCSPIGKLSRLIAHRMTIGPCQQNQLGYISLRFTRTQLAAKIYSHMVFHYWYSSAASRLSFMCSISTLYPLGKQMGFSSSLMPSSVLVTLCLSTRVDHLNHIFSHELFHFVVSLCPNSKFES